MFPIVDIEPVVQPLPLEDLLPQLEEGAKEGGMVSCGVAWRLALDLIAVKKEIAAMKEWWGHAED